MRRLFNFSLCFVLCLSFISIGRTGHTQEVRRRFPIVATASDHAIVWTNLTNATVVGGNELQSTDGSSNWLSGGSSTESLSAGDLGYVQITAANSVSRMFGLGTTNTGGGFERIEFAMWCQAGGGIETWESGRSDEGSSSWTAGDVLAVRRNGNNSVDYLKNGSVFHTSGSTNSGVLYANGAMEVNNENLENVTLSAGFH